MKINEFLKNTTNLSASGMFGIRPRVTCADGFSMSVQASKYHYCDPRIDLYSGQYKEVEIGFPSGEEPLINEYAEIPEDWTGTVYGYVPVEIVDAVIEKHGGMKE